MSCRLQSNMIVRNSHPTTHYETHQLYGQHIGFIYVTLQTCFWLWACIVYSTIDLCTNLLLSNALEIKSTTQGRMLEDIVSEGDDCEGY